MNGRGDDASKFLRSQKTGELILQLCCIWNCLPSRKRNPLQRRGLRHGWEAYRHARPLPHPPPARQRILVIPTPGFFVPFGRQLFLPRFPPVSSRRNRVPFWTTRPPPLVSSPADTCLLEGIVMACCNCCCEKLDKHCCDGACQDSPCDGCEGAGDCGEGEYCCGGQCVPQSELVAIATPGGDCGDPSPCQPDETCCPTGCCPETNWWCCIDASQFCAATPCDCPRVNPLP
jgi:hypothetical protein